MTPLPPSPPTAAGVNVRPSSVQAPSQPVSAVPVPSQSRPSRRTPHKSLEERRLLESVPAVPVFSLKNL